MNTFDWVLCGIAVVVVGGWLFVRWLLNGEWR